VAWQQAARVRELFLSAYGGRTESSYRSDLKLFWLYAHKIDTAPLAFTRATLEAFGKYQSQARGLRPSTCARRMSVLAGYFACAVDEGVIDLDPMVRVRRPRVPTDSPVPGLDRAQLRHLQLGAGRHSSRAHALIALLVENGLRVSEALGLDVTDVLEMNSMVVIRIVRKGGKVALVPLAEATALALQRYVGDRRTGPVFLSKSGRRLAPDGANELLRAVGRLVMPASEAQGLHCHRVRHGWVSAGLDSGISLVEMQAAAGHASPTTTGRYDRARGEVSRNHPTFQISRWLNLGDGEDVG
jgi:site-specific recombinase XerD